MLSAEERYRLLEEASALSAKWDYSAVLDLVESANYPGLPADPELTFLHAQALYRTGHYDAASDLLTALESADKSRFKDQLYCRRCCLMGAVNVDRGNLHAGRSRFSEVLFIATSHGYKPQIASSIMNLGVIASICCQWDEALASYERAIVAYEQIGNRYHLAGVHHNLGITLREMGNYGPSSMHFDKALQLFHTCPALAEIAYCLAERALLLNAEGEAALAEAAARKSLEMLVTLRPPGEGAEALRALGVILMTTHRLEEASDCLTQGLVLALGSNARMVEAEINEDLALLNQLCRRRTEATTHLLAAEVIYRRMGAEKRAERARERFVRVLPLRESALPAGRDLHPVRGP